MAEAVRAKPQPDIGPDCDPLGYWLAQEGDPGLPQDLPAALPEGRNARLLSGWWLLPVMVMAVPIWAAILWIMLRG